MHIVPTYALYPSRVKTYMPVLCAFVCKTFINNNKFVPSSILY